MISFLLGFGDQSSFVDDRDVYGSRFGNKSRNPPARVFENECHLFSRHPEVLEPRADILFVSNANSELARESAALAIVFMIIQMGFSRRRIWVRGFRNNPRAGGRHITHFPQKPPGALHIAEQTEIGAHHEHAIELTEPGGNLRDIQNAGIREAAFTGHFNRQGRDVNARYVESLLLKMDGVSSRTAADVEYASANMVHRFTLMSRPVAIWLEVIGRIAGVHATVVAFADFLCGDTPMKVPHHASISVVIVCHISFPCPG